MSKAYLTAAGSILTVESRHSSYIRATIDQKPFPQPFDAPLSLNQVFSLASQFITSCPESNPPLPVMAFPVLTLDPTTPAPVTTGHTVTLQTPVSGNPTPILQHKTRALTCLQEYILQPAHGDPHFYAAFIAVTGPTFVEAMPVEGGFTMEIPEGFAGQTYVVLTIGNEGVSDDTIAAGPAIIEV